MHAVNFIPATSWTTCFACEVCSVRRPKISFYPDVNALSSTLLDPMAAPEKMNTVAYIEASEKKTTISYDASE